MTIRPRRSLAGSGRLAHRSQIAQNEPDVVVERIDIRIQAAASGFFAGLIEFDKRRNRKVFRVDLETDRDVQLLPGELQRDGSRRS